MPSSQDPAEPPPPSTAPSSSSADTVRARHYRDELALVEQERTHLLSILGREFATDFADPFHALSNRLRAAADLREYQLANLDATIRVEHQQAADEYDLAKRRRRRGMLAISVERRRRLDGLRVTAVAKKKKRRGAAAERGARALRTADNRAFLASLEHQGLVRVALTPDEVNNDLALILNGLDSARVHPPPHERAPEAVVRAVEKVQSSKGTLHYHDVVYEKGDRVAVWGGRGGEPRYVGGLRYLGAILSVNSKEMQIRRDDGPPVKIYVSHLRSGRFVLKPANSAETAS